MKVLSKIAEIFFPSHCLFCEKIISKNGLFCSECWPKLQFVTNPKCPICSYPFEIEIAGMQPLCSRCLVKKPSYDKVITIFRYNQILRKVISDLKYRDQTFLAKKFAKILLEKSQDEISSTDLIVAVPLHKTRLGKRKFNQAVLLCRNMIKNLQKTKNIDTTIPKFYPDFLLKVKNTTPQAELRKKQREKNLKRAFLVNQKYRDLVKDKKILLVDDVMTTGVTIENCAKELKRRGAKMVIVLTIAKTVFNRSN